MTKFFPRQETPAIVSKTFRVYGEKLTDNSPHKFSHVMDYWILQAGTEVTFVGYFADENFTQAIIQYTNTELKVTLEFLTDWQNIVLLP